MDSNRSTEVKVGIGVILAAIVLILGVMWIGEFRLSRGWQTYSVYFDEVGGLSEGDPVAVSGLDLGKVGAIMLEEGRVRTDLLIEEEVVLRSDCSVEIRSIGLMGERYIYIMPGGSDEVLPPGSILEGDFKAGLPEVVAEVGDMMDEMRSAAESLKRIVTSMDEEYTLGESLAKLNEASSEIIELLRENRDDIRSTTRSMKTISGDVSDIVGGKKDDIRESIDTFSRAASRLDSVTGSLKGLVESVETGEGSLGMLIKEKKLHEDAERALKSLNDLIKDIKEHPERYVKIEIF